MRQAFSLVELSIVLVILGLLTGGILAGQSLIRASEMRAVTAEYQRYMSATSSFRDKYFAIPGDFSGATRFWNRLAAVASCVSNSGLAVAGTPGACDGGGNGQLSAGSGAGLSSENFQYWRQLALAGLIEGDYSGVAGPGGAAHGIIGTTVPASKLGNAGWGVTYAAAITADAGDNFISPGGNIMTFGTATSASYPFYAALKPEEAWNIDTKMDDGKPAYGNIRSWRGGAGAVYTPNCADTGVSSTAQYNLTNTSIACALIFYTGF